MLTALEAPVEKAPSLEVKTNSDVAPAEAAVRLQKRFRRVARKLVKFDRDLRLDVVQEMSLAVLRCTESHKLAWFQQLGFWRALDFLRRIADRPRAWHEKAAQLKIMLSKDREFQRAEFRLLAEG